MPIEADMPRTGSKGLAKNLACEVSVFSYAGRIADDL